MTFGIWKWRGGGVERVIKELGARFLRESDMQCPQAPWESLAEHSLFHGILALDQVQNLRVWGAAWRYPDGKPGNCHFQDFGLQKLLVLRRP